MSLPRRKAIDAPSLSSSVKIRLVVLNFRERKSVRQCREEREREREGSQSGAGGGLTDESSPAACRAELAPPSEPSVLIRGPDPVDLGVDDLTQESNAWTF